MPTSEAEYAPITDSGDLARLRLVLADRPRDLLLFELAIQTGVLMKHLLQVRAGHLLGVSPGEPIPFPREFGGRAIAARMSEDLFRAFELYRKQARPEPEDLLFPSRKGGTALQLTSASALINNWYRAAGLTGLSGASSLRKTYEYRKARPQGSDAAPVSNGSGSGPVLKPVRAATLREMVYDQLLKAIVGGHIKAGEQIVIDKVAESMQVSPMPVRDALARLAAAGVVATNRKRRFIVNQLTPAEWSEVQEIRLSLEAKAAAAACRRSTPALVQKLKEIHDVYSQPDVFQNADLAIEINRQFHYAIYENAGKPILLQFIRNLWDRASPYLHLMYEEQSRQEYAGKNLSHDHEKIIEGMTEGDEEKVVRHLRNDLIFGMSLVERLITPK